MRFVDTDFRAQLRAARLVFFDCDGVIFDSNGFKLAAMDRVLSDYPEPLRQSMASFWRNNGGMSRHVKFEHFFRELAPSPDWESLTRAAVERFGEYSLDGYRHVDALPGALALMQSIGRERLVVVSGADQAELHQVFQLKQLDPLVSEVLGAPIKKLDLVKTVLEARGLRARDTLFIGDGARDFEVCQTLRMPFVYLHQYSEWDHAVEVLSGGSNVSWAQSWDDLLRAAGLAS